MGGAGHGPGVAVSTEDDPETTGSAELAGWFLDPADLAPQSRRGGVVTGAFVGDAPCAKTRCAWTSARLAFGRSVGGTVSFFGRTVSSLCPARCSRSGTRAGCACAGRNCQGQYWSTLC
ncbi:MAG: hypothetical protein ACK56F_09945, partial [bacterium]